MVGYDVGNRPTINTAFRCPECTLVLRDPVQLDCGHRACKSCTEALNSEIIKCATCSENSMKTDLRLDKGFKNDMQKLVVMCTLCAWQGPLKTYENHLETAHPHPICSHCGQKYPSVAHLDYHKLNQCEKITVPCALKDFGCVQDVIRVKMPQHYLTIEHQTALAQFVRLISFKTVDQRPIDSHTMDVDLIPQIHIATGITSNQSTISELQNAHEIKDILGDGENTLKRDTERINAVQNESDRQLKELNGDVQKLKLSVEEHNKSIILFGPRHDDMSKEIAVMNGKLLKLPTISYDGTLLWKITNAREIIAKAKANEQPSISSPAFFSSLTGYKMQARLYPMGDGNGNGTHMSLFFVLMRSEYDAILRFPFPYKITFCLFDQTAAQKHIVDSFRPDVKSGSFQRPTSEKNTASGLPRFVSLQDIQKEDSPYIRDDTMFIRIAVDFNDLPKILAQYAVSINPSLPASLQQNLIKQEAEKRSQQTQTLSSKSLSQKPTTR